MSAPSSRFPWRRALAGGVAALALTSLAACGGGDSDSGSSSVFDSEASSSSAAASGSSDHQPGDTVAADEMASLYKKALSDVKTAHMTMSGKVSVGGQSLTMDGEGDVSMNPLAEDVTMSMMGQKMRLIMVDGVEYLQADASSDTWLKMNLADVAKESGMGDLSSALTNPLSMIDAMSDAITKATYVGSDSTGEHYQATVDMKKAMEATSGKATLPAGVPASMDEDMWFDKDGHLAKMTIDMGDSGSVETEMSDYGKSVDIEAPPASKVTDMGSLGGLPTS
ncbi:LppX_LprAFG lipoprotein [Nocardioides sp. DS6]|uniref:LppX_LprAFG lipoprotein n=1 Tax=Nocardioides eburneus TaxID=3231482 RepID=A0ABV3SVN8_9ACTN